MKKSVSKPLVAAFLISAMMSAGAAEAESIRRVPRDYPSIQAAIDAAQTRDLILVDPGTYRERIRLKAGITVKSSGDDSKGQLGLKRAEATIIDGAGGVESEPGVTMAEDAALDGFTVTGVGKYDEARWNQHHATQGNQQSHAEIGAPGVAGISVIGIERCTVTHNIVHHIGYTGIAIMGAEGKRVSPQILRNVTYRNMGGGIGSMMGSTALIAENVSFENFYAGIGLDKASPFIVSNICYANVRAGIGVSEGSKPVVRGNKCYKNRRAGIGVRTGADTRPVIEDNDCYQNDMAGIGADEHAAPIIRGNRCYENAMAGIGAQEGSSPAIIGNACYRNQQSGIGSRGNAKVLAVGNECYENKLAGIGQSENAETTLIGNYCHHNQTTGIGFDSCETGVATVVNNRVIDNDLVAMGIQSGWKVQLTGNELSRKGGMPPIVMVFEGADATFANNTIRGDGVAGIRVAGTVTATGNLFEAGALRKVGPPSYAIWALEGSSVTMNGNQVKSYRHALDATGGAVNASHNTVNDFFRHAFVVRQPSQPANVFNNTAITGDEKAEVLLIEGSQGVVSGNEAVPAETKKP